MNLKLTYRKRQNISVLIKELFSRPPLYKVSNRYFIYVGLLFFCFHVQAVNCWEEGCLHFPSANQEIAMLAEICDNGIDDDGDGLIDCADPDCQTANLPCNIITLTSVEGAYLGSSGTSGFCLFCSVSSEANVIDANTSNHASISIPVGVFGSGYIDVNLGTVYPAGTRAGFVADVNGGIAGLFNGVTLTTYLNGSQQQSISGGSLINILGIGGDRNIAATFCQPFDRIRITAGSLAGVLANYQVFHAFAIAGCQYPTECGTPVAPEVCNDSLDNDGDGLVDGEDSDCLNFSTCTEICDNGTDDDGDGLIDCDDPDCQITVSVDPSPCSSVALTSAEGTSVEASGTNGICLFCSVSGEANVIDANTSNHASISIPVGVFGSGYIDVNLGTVYPAGTRAGFVADVNGGIAGLFNGVTLTTYLNGSQQQSISGSSLFNILGIGGDRNVAATFCQPFDRMRITAGSLAGVLANYQVFHAFAITDCQYPTVCGLPAVAEICNDNIDNDGDGLVDGEDDDCTSTTAVTICSNEICDNGIDDDGDGLIDEFDPDCVDCSSGTTNLALGRSTTQSSTSSGGSSSRAVDGNTSGSWGNNSITHTSNQTHAWWQVDLGSQQLINDVVLWNRTDCCSNRLSNFYVFVSDVPFTSTDPTTTVNQSGVWSELTANYPNSSLTLSPGGIVGRYVRVQLAGTNVLSLAEVQVIGCEIPVPSCDNVTPLSGVDSDGDGVDNACDLDDDNDGISDCEEKGLLNVTFNDLFDLAGSARQMADNEVRLTPNSQNQAGSVFTYQKVDFNQDFSFTFEANMGGNNGGADGIAIVFHNDSRGSKAVGLSGVGLGARGIQDGIVLELDDFANGSGFGVGDIGEDHGMIWNSENQSSPGQLTPAVALGNIEDGAWHTVSMNWDATNQVISYEWDGQTAGIYSGDLINNFFGGSNLVHFGFTASTGMYHNDQRIRFTNGFCGFPAFVDTDGDGIENYLDLDSDGDGCFDAVEYYGTQDADEDDDGIYGTGTPTVDDNGSVTGASYSGNYTHATNSVFDACADCDNDGIINVEDLDDDNDGVADIVENNPGTGGAGSAITSLIFEETFGRGTSPVDIGGFSGSPFTGLNYDINGPTNDNGYRIDDSENNDFSQWSSGSDNTAGDVNGRFMVINAGTTKEDLYTIQVLIEPGTGVRVQFDARNLLRVGSNSTYNPNVSFEVRDLLGNVLGEVYTGDIPRDEAWRTYDLTVDAGGESQLEVALVNHRFQNNGNDLGLDNIRIYQSMADTDGDGIPNKCDLDSDEDGCSDANEYYHSLTADGGDGGEYGTGTPSVDTTGFVTSAAYSGEYTNAVNATVTDACQDWDNDGVPDVDDLDDDNDGVTDVDEGLVECTDQNDNGFNEDLLQAGYHSTLIQTVNDWIISGEGLNGSGSDQLSFAYMSDIYTYPAGLSPLKVTMGGHGNVVALFPNGDIYYAGDQTNSEIGQVLDDGNITSGESWARTNLSLPNGVNPTDVKCMRAAGHLLLIVTQSGALYVTGQEARGQIDPDFSDVVFNRIFMPAGVGVADAKIARSSLLILGTDNRLYRYGDRTYDGNGSSQSTVWGVADLMIQPPLSGDLIQFALGNNCSIFVLDSDGTVHVLGENSGGQLGIGNTSDQTSWTTIPNFTGVKYISSSVNGKSADAGFGSGFIGADDRVYSFGINDEYILTDASSTGIRSTPMLATGVNENAIALVMGGHISPYISYDFGIYNTGHNKGGGFGDGTTTDRNEYSGTSILGILADPNFEVCQSVELDNDGDGIPNHLDLDSDDDGCSDANEYYDSPVADGGDGGEYGIGSPAVDSLGLVIAASYTGDYTNAIEPNIRNACREICDNGIDDDNDGLIDCEDPDCSGLIQVTTAATALDICAGESTTIAANTSGGSSPYSYTWDNGLGNGISHNISPLITTTYTVTVTDAGGCTDSEQIMITVGTCAEDCTDGIDNDGDGLVDCDDPDCALSLTANASNASCGNNDGQVSIAVSGGYGSYEYSINNIAWQPINTFSGLAAGSYTFYVRNDDGSCAATVTADVLDGCEDCTDGIDNDGDGLVDCADPDCAPIINTSSNASICVGSSTNLSVTATGSAAPFTYVWDNGLGNGDLHTVNPMANTTYTVTVTNTLGCSSTTTVVVSVNSCPEDCTDGIDNDGDGLIDCDDPDCQAVGMPLAVDDEFTTCPSLLPFINMVSINDGNLQMPSYTIVTPPTVGTMTMNSFGMFTYYPANEGCGSVSFTYQVCNVNTGCCNTADATINIGDNVAPVLSNIPADISISCNDEVPQPSAVTALDACPFISIEVTETDDMGSLGSCNNYTITRTWTATDLCGNSASASQNIYVSDPIRPEIFRVYNLESGQKLIAGNAQRTSHLWKYVKFPVHFDSPPLIFAQVVSENEASAVAVQTRFISTTGFEMRLREEEAGDNIHLGETVSWMAIEAGSFDNGMQLAANLMNNVGDNSQALAYPFTFDSAPNFIALTNGLAEQDPVTVRANAQNANGLNVSLMEEESADSETGHAGERLAWMAFSNTDFIPDENGGFVGESGTVTTDENWATVTFGNTYNKPVVLLGGLSANSANAATIRVRNVTLNSFEVRVQEWDYLDGNHPNRSLSYLVIEGGIPTGEEQFCFNYNPLQVGVDIIAIDNCDEQVAFDYSENVTNLEDGNQYLRSWIAVDDCGNVNLISRMDTCRVAALRMRSMLNGAMINTQGQGLMHDILRVKGLVPEKEPYSDLPGFVHQGNGGFESFDSDNLSLEGENAITDWVFVECRSKYAPHDVLATQSAILQRNGTVRNLGGDTIIYFRSLPQDDYMVSVRHRNHLGLMTAAPWNLDSADPPLLDFTDKLFPVNGGGFGGKFNHDTRTMWAGDFNGDGKVIYQGPSNDVFYLFSKVLSAPDNIEFLANYIVDGYHREDYNLDGQVIYQGPNNDRAYILFYTTFVHGMNDHFLANYIVDSYFP